VDQPVSLVPLVCPQCATPVPARLEERAWVCGQCGMGLVLDESKGLAPLTVHYSTQVVRGGTGKPFWTAIGNMRLQRETFAGDKDRDAERFWSQPRRFFVPAFECPLETQLSLGNQMLLQTPDLQEGPAVAFEMVTIGIEDVKALAEFIAMTIEAGRDDKLKEVRFTLDLAEPELWILP
jgi:hypothetical protein